MAGLGTNTPIPLVDEIKAAVVRHYGLTLADMRSADRARRVSHPRQVAMYLARKLTTNSYPKIARLLGKRDHTTVLYGCRAVRARIAANPDFERTIDRLAANLFAMAERRLTAGRREVGPLVVVVKTPAPSRLPQARY